MSDFCYYMVRPIDNSSAFENFIKRSVVAVGWSDHNFVDYGAANAVIEKIDYLKNISSKTAGRHCAQIKRFFNIKKDDKIVVPSGDSVYLAIATQTRGYNEKACDLDQANEIVVNYVKDKNGIALTIRRDCLSEGLQRRLRVPGMAVNDLIEFADELKKFFSKGINEMTSYSWTEDVRKYISNKTENFKTKLLENIQSGKTGIQTGGKGLEKLVKELLTIEGYKADILHTRTFPSFADADVIAVKSDRFNESKLLCQIKHHSGTSDSWGIEQLLEIKRLPENYEDYQLVFITSAQMAEDDKKKAEEMDVKVFDGVELVSWIADSIDSLSCETKIALGIIEVPQTV